MWWIWKRRIRKEGGVIEVKQCVCLTEDLTSFSVNPPLALIRVAMKDL